ncbi:hypothetical protein [Desulfovibrio falkowii]|uniref:hypothetical protein n=1 Tax=Desulfovibrio sp. WGS1351 TaxID=3366814 RepID=UPI00372D4D89
MAIAERLITMLGQWAKGAQTNIPTPPVPGIAYRNAGLTAADIEGGQAYDKVYDSARYNQVDFLTTGIVQAVEQYGILPWSSLTNYPASGICMGLDGVIYQALQPSGPNNGGAQPTNNAAFWKHAIAQQQMDPIGGIRFFEDEMPRPGYVECNAGVVSNFSVKYPEMAAYLETPWGQARLVSSLAEYETLHTAIWHTNADGTTVGWQGIGGVAKFWWDKTADTLKMPDLQDMFQAAAGPSLGVGGVDGDQGRNANGSALVVTGTGASGSGALYHPGGPSEFLTGQGSNNARFSSLSIDLSRVVPIGPTFAPRRWGALACAYLGQPAS